MNIEFVGGPLDGEVRDIPPSVNYVQVVPGASRPYRFTRQDVDFLREIVDAAPLEMLRMFNGRMASLIERIESVVPGGKVK